MWVPKGVKNWFEKQILTRFSTHDFPVTTHTLNIKKTKLINLLVSKNELTTLATASFY